MALYARFIFHKRTIAWGIWVGLIAIYGFMFVVLNSQNYALLMGSVGLFLILGIVMVATRNFNYYDPNNVKG